MPVTQEIGSALAGPPVDPVFAKSLNQLAATARVGHRLDNKFFNPSNEWLPREICGEAEYVRRVLELRHKRYYGKHVEDNAGILWYTKVTEAVFDFDDVPALFNECEWARPLSLYWHAGKAYNSLADLAEHLSEEERPPDLLFESLGSFYEAGPAQCLDLSLEGKESLRVLGIGVR